MIDRIVLFKLKDEYANDDARAEIAAHSREALGLIPGLVEVRVGVPADEASTRSWDLSIVVRFADLEAMNAYVEHPDHMRYYEYMVPRMEVVKYWAFDVPV